MNKINMDKFDLSLAKIFYGDAVDSFLDWFEMFDCDKNALNF